MTVRELFEHFVLMTNFVLMKNEPILDDDINKYIYEAGTIGEWYECGENYGDWVVSTIYINHLSEEMVVRIYEGEEKE